jgi:hypothetical protein
MKNRLLLTLLGLLCVSVLVHSAEAWPIINEIQSSNTATLTDEDGVAEDWLELYNGSSAPVNLAGWSLTDEVNEPRKWTFTQGQIPAGGYLVIFTSGKDRKAGYPYFHTNFKLSASGDYLALTAPSGVRVSEVNPVPCMGADTSYGLVQGAWAFLGLPSPGAVNPVQGLLRYPAPVFDRTHGFYSAPFALRMSSPIGAARIFYTLDGSEPSAVQGTLYTAPITVSTTSVVRAVAVAPLSGSPALPASPVTTRTFLFKDDIVRQTNTPQGYPTKWGPYASIRIANTAAYDTAIADYEMDPELMAEPLYVDKVKASFDDLPIVSLVTDKGFLFSKSTSPDSGGIYIYTNPPQCGHTVLGDGWERPVSFEYFYPAKDLSVQADASMELHGGHSRWPEKNPKHSFRIDFKEKYGLNKLRYPILGTDGPNLLNSLILRAGFSDSWLHWNSSAPEQPNATYTRDQWAKLTQLRMGNPASHGVYAHLFINGIYWGLYNPNERICDDFLQYWNGGEKTDYDVIKVSEDNGVEASDGTLEMWSALTSTVASISGVDSVADYEIYQAVQGKNPDGTRNAALPCLLDVENFIDYMLLNFYNGNQDWDYHNWIACKNNAKPEEGFRFFAWDSECVVRGVNDNTVLLSKYASSKVGDLTRMFNKLKTLRPFCLKVADRVQKYFFNGGALTEQQAAQTFTDLTDQTQNALYAESARWGDYRRDVHQYNTPKGQLYRKDVQFDAQKTSLLTDYFPKRTGIVLGQLKSAGLFPAVDAPVVLVNGSVATSDTLYKGDRISLTATTGTTIYYTLDGTDPVQYTSAAGFKAQSAAKTYSSTIVPIGSVTLKARASGSGTWSALSKRNFVYLNPDAVDPSVHQLESVTAACFPSHFRTATTFRYVLPVSGKVTLQLFDVAGRLVNTLADAVTEAGTYDVPFDGSRLSAGVYLCRMTLQGDLNRTVTFRFTKY